MTARGRAPSGRLRKGEEQAEPRQRARTAFLSWEIQAPTAQRLGFVPSALFRGFCFRVSVTSFESRGSFGEMWPSFCGVLDLCLACIYMPQVGVHKGNLAGV